VNVFVFEKTNRPIDLMCQKNRSIIALFGVFEGIIEGTAILKIKNEVDLV
jgi:hypothetical protein